MRGQLKPGDLKKKRYFLSTRAMNLFMAGKRQMVTLHEKDECLHHACGVDPRAEISLAQARTIARETRTFLCLRCGSLK